MRKQICFGTLSPFLVLWSTLTSHFDYDQIVTGPSQSELEDDSVSAAAELAKQLECQPLDETNRLALLRSISDKSDPPKKGTTPMDVDYIADTTIRCTALTTKEKSGTTGGNTLRPQTRDDGSDVEMKDDNIEMLNISVKGEEEQLHLDDFDKYTATTKFNHKNFKAGQGQGTASLAKSSFELLFTQVKIIMDEMFSIISMSRYIHLVGNSRLKVWSKWTAKTV